MARIKKTRDQLKEDYLKAREASVSAKSIKAYQKAAAAYGKALWKDREWTQAQEVCCCYFVDMMHRYGTEDGAAFDTWMAFMEAFRPKDMEADDFIYMIRMILHMVPNGSCLFLFVYSNYLTVLYKDGDRDDEIQDLLDIHRRIGLYLHEAGSQGRIVNYMCEAEVLSNLDDYDEEEEMYTQAWEESLSCPDLNPEVLRRLVDRYGHILQADGNADRLEEFINHILKSPDPHLKAIGLYLKGNLLMENGNTDEAESILKEALALGSRNLGAAIVNILADIEMDRGNNKKAYDMAKAAILGAYDTRNSEVMELHYKAAKAALALGKAKEAYNLAQEGFNLMDPISSRMEENWLQLLIDTSEAAGKSQKANFYRGMKGVFDSTMEKAKGLFPNSVDGEGLDLDLDDPEVYGLIKNLLTSAFKDINEISENYLGDEDE